LGVPGDLPQQLLSAAAGQWQLCGPQALSNTLHAAAVLQVTPSLDWQAGFWQASAKVMVQAEPQHLSNMAWAAATLGLTPPELWQQLWLESSRLQLLQQRMTAQGLSNSLWAVAKLGWGPAVIQQYQQQQQQQLEEHHGSSSSSPACWLHDFLQCSLDLLDSFSDQGLTNSCWALGRIALQQQQQHEVQDLLASTGWLDRVLFVLQPRLLHFNTQQLSNTLWGLAASNTCLPEPWLDTFTRVSGPRLPGFKTQEASSTLVALARLAHSPGPAWLRLYEASLARQLSSASSQTLVNTVWAMGRLGHTPGPGLMQGVLMQLQARLRGSHPAGGSSSSGMTGSSRMDSSSSSSGSGEAGWEFSAAGLSVLVLSLVKLLPPGALGAHWWELLLQAVTSTFSSSNSSSNSSNSISSSMKFQFNAHSLASLAGAAALVPDMGDGTPAAAVAADIIRRQHFVTAMLVQMATLVDQQQQQQQSSQQVSMVDVSMVLWAAAKVGLQPPADQLLPLLQHAQDLLPTLQQQHAPAASAASSIETDSSGSSSHSHAAREPSIGGNVTTPSSSGVAEGGYKALGALAYALGVLGYHPGSTWVSGWLAATGRLLGACSPCSLVLLLWGTLWLEEVPPRAWTRAWAAAWKQQTRLQQQQQQAGMAGVLPMEQRALQWAAAAAAQGLSVLQAKGSFRQSGGTRQQPQSKPQGTTAAAAAAAPAASKGVSGVVAQVFAQLQGQQSGASSSSSSSSRSRRLPPVVPASVMPSGVASWGVSDAQALQALCCQLLRQAKMWQKATALQQQQQQQPPR
jgi:hypothetical protein